MTIYVYFVRRKTETMTHFTKCKSYENFPKENDCTQVLQNNTDDQFQIAETIRKRLQTRRRKKLKITRLVILMIGQTPGLQETVKQCDISYITFLDYIIKQPIQAHPHLSPSFLVPLSVGITNSEPGPKFICLSDLFQQTGVWLPYRLSDCQTVVNIIRAVCQIGTAKVTPGEV